MWDHASLVMALGVESELREFSATSVEIDSRKIKQGAIFVALKGEHYDGHDFIMQAIDAGAVCCVVEQLPSVLLEVPCVVVTDSLQALCEMASFARARINGKVIGVTGSVGKTSMKEMLRCALARQGETYVTSGNYNNHYGVPLTLANMPKTTEYAVIEMGMNAPGEISNLSQLAKPDVAIVTNVSAVHIEFFSSVAAIADAKAEIIDGLSPNGTVIINMDNIYNSIISAKANSLGIKILGFSKNNNSEFKVKHVEYKQGVTHVTASCCDKKISYVLNVFGEHVVLNSLAVLAAIYAVDAELEFAARELKDFTPVAGRGVLKHLPKQQITIIDESYNASVASMTATINSLKHYKTENNRVIAVLGDMLELGIHGKELHLQLRDIIDGMIDEVYTVGPLSRHLHEALPKKQAKGHFDNVDQLCEVLPASLVHGDVLLVKGSRGMRMERVIQAVFQYFGA